ncbi:CoA transferase [Sporosarcina sp. 179-K 3D1 HS]|uniref:CaiB/BaiF CoA transferase family protein n=1 Tax=Sporosarcina sp. 179-K 3D1 HS TaxID=3232169 RepID=UPI0039A15541
MENTKEMNVQEFGPLRGLKVLDIGTLIAGPFSAGLFADFGADVIKVEMPGVGDSTRNMGKKTKKGGSLAWANGGRNKRSITLDMRTEEGQKLIYKLVEWADVLIENFSPGTLEKWNMDYATLSEINPRLIMARVSAYGQTGPNSYKPGLDRIALAYSGVSYVTGHPDRPPVRMGISIADYLTGAFNALGVLMAVYYRDVVGYGKGQQIDLGLYEAPFRITEDIVSQYAAYGEIRERAGNGHPFLAPAEVFETEDGKWITIHAGLDNAFKRLAKAMGQEELATNPRFSGIRERAENADEIHAIVGNWVKRHPSHVVLEKLDKAGVPVAPVNNIADIFEDQHFHERENIVEIGTPELGQIKVPGVVPKFSESPGKIAWAGKSLGEDNQAVYMGLLGLEQEEFESLREKQVI